MKTGAILSRSWPALALIILPAAAQAAPVARVLVFPDRALVTREATAPCGQRVRVPFGAVPPGADPESVRAAITNGTVDGLRVQVVPRAERYAPRLREVAAALRKEQATLAALSDEEARAANGAQVASDYAARAVTLIGREMLDGAATPRAWMAAFESALRAQVRAAGDRVDVAARRREALRRLSALQGEQARLQGGGDERDEREVEVVVSCPAGQRALVGLSYLVGGVSWTPSYEARLSEAGDRIDLATFATVSQHSGEDWIGARLTLSTALPRQDATPPELAPLWVRTAGEAPKTKIVVSRSEYTRHAEAPAGLSGGTGGEQVDGRLKAVAQGLSVQLQAPEPAEVRADGVPVRIFVGRTRIPAQLRLRTVPKLCPYVFRVADLVNRAPYPLLPGSMDLFAGSEKGARFLGRQALPRIGQGERFTLTFGIEDRVKVKREIIEEVARDRGFLGPSRRRRYGYRFQISSYLARADAVELSEHVPVSEIADIKVGLDGQTTPGYELRGPDGIITWRVPLKPGARRDLALRYHVEVPASYDTGSD